MSGFPKNCPLCNCDESQVMPKDSNYLVDCPKCRRYLMSDMMYLKLTEEPEHIDEKDEIFDFSNTEDIVSIMVRKKSSEKCTMVKLHTDDAKKFIMDFQRITTSDRKNFLLSILFSKEMSACVCVDDGFRMDVLCKSMSDLNFLLKSLNEEGRIESCEGGVRLTLRERERMEAEQKKDKRMGFIKD